MQEYSGISNVCSSGALCVENGPLGKMAAHHRVSPSQVAIAWLLERLRVMLPIPGTASIAHLEENVAAANVKLTEDDITELDLLHLA